MRAFTGHRLFRLGLTAAVAAWALVVLSVANSWAEPSEDAASPPDVILLNELEQRYKPVPFEHRLHADMAEMWNGCETCHHRKPNGHAKTGQPAANGETTHTQAESAEIPACKSCHPIGESEDNIRMPKLSAAYHRQCLDCHRDWDDKDSCVACHEPIEGTAMPADAPTPDAILGRMHPPAEPPTTITYEARFTPAAGRYVTFRHDEHVEAFGFKCVECHRRDSCDNCHSADGQVSVRSPLKPAESWRRSHEPCLTCHDHQTCDHCHHQTEQDAPPKFEHRMTGQLLDADHQDLPCRGCHGSVNFTAVPTCGDASCHESPDMAAYPDKRPGEVIATIEPRVHRRSLSAVLGVEPRVGHADLTNATDTIIPEPEPLPPVRPRQHMTTVERPTTPTESCVTAECHVAIKSYDVVHGPVAADACGVCHELVDEKTHQFKILRDRQELCTYCHEFDVDAMPVIHAPAKDGECLGCHNPHGGHDRSLTREASIERLCDRCHESVTEMQAFRHTPVEKGYCVSCHSPHASQYPNLLDAVGPDLCLSCHDEFGKQLDSVRFVHKAMDEQCEKCHNVHGSAFPDSLTAPVPTLCLDCHGDIAEKMADSAYPHSPVTEDPACLTCHTPHGSDLASLMRDLPIRLCLECHNQPVQTPDGRTIADMNRALSTDLYKHGPINDGECGGCHDPHGSDHTLLLTDEFEEGYYTTDAKKAYALCLECHNRALVAEPQVATGEDSPTRFRNGSLNLHYLHVANGLGRNCRACHGIHTADNPHLLLANVPFKQWQAPLELIETDTGGRCLTGCHLPFSYDRVNPVALKDQREAGEEVKRIRAAMPEDVNVQWQGVDTSGGAVVLPAEDAPTLLMFSGADPDQNTRTIHAVREALSLRSGTRVVLAVSPDTEGQNLDAIREAIGPDWQVVVEDQALVNAARIKARPIILVVRSDGRIIARIGGAPRALALKLEAYLDMAKLDQAVKLSLESIKPQVVGRSSVVDAEQYSRVARQLMLGGEPDRAEKTLLEGLDLHPKNEKLYTDLVTLLNQTNRADEALDLLNRLPEDTLDPQVAMRLRARAYIESGQWEQATELLTHMLNTDPNQPEVNRMMAEVYEHNNQWREAAECYRRVLNPE